jgi:hypothetical protein
MTQSLTTCVYLQEQHNYVSGCGFRAAYNKFWRICPYCGRHIVCLNQSMREKDRDNDIYAPTIDQMHALGYNRHYTKKEKG